MQDFIFDRIFEKETFDGGAFPWREYEQCTFRNCDFYQADLTGYRFCSCSFENCNLSVAVIDDVVFQDIVFRDCKMLGLRFDRCSKFGFSVSFTGCQLDNTSFRETKLKKTRFDNCRMVETDFSEADLTSSVFEKCDLERAVFHFSVLEKADLTTAFNFSIDPEVNRLKRSKFSIYGLPGLLSKYDLDISES